MAAVSRAVMSMAVHGADSDEGTSMAALDLKAGKGAPVMWSPKNENLGRFFEQSSCLQELDKFVLHFCLTIWYVVPQSHVASRASFA